MNYTVDWIGGNCPVQAEGVVDGKPFYFRARGDRWSLSVDLNGSLLNPEWSYVEPYGGTEFSAGWMEEDVALEMIEKAIGIYLREKNESSQ